MVTKNKVVQICLIEGSDPVVKLKGGTPMGAYRSLLERTKTQLDYDLSQIEWEKQYQEIGSAVVDTRTGEILDVNITVSV